MGNPLDTKERLTLLDLDDLIAYRAGKFPSASRWDNPVTQTNFSSLLIRLHPTTNNVFTGSHLLAQQGYGEPFLQLQLHTTKLELKPIPLPIPTFFLIALLFNSTNLFHGYTPFSLSECHPFSPLPLSHDLVVSAICQEMPVRFLLVSGQPIGERVAWYGPIVMNTQEELRIAFEEYEKGTFIKHR
jgi:hypothetical protein